MLGIAFTYCSFSSSSSCPSCGRSHWGEQSRRFSSKVLSHCFSSLRSILCWIPSFLLGSPPCLWTENVTQDVRTGRQLLCVPDSFAGHCSRSTSRSSLRLIVKDFKHMRANDGRSDLSALLYSTIKGQGTRQTQKTSAKVYVAFWLAHPSTQDLVIEMRFLDSEVGSCHSVFVTSLFSACFGRFLFSFAMDFIGPKIRAAAIAVLSAFGALLFGLDIGHERVGCDILDKREGAEL